MLMLYLVTHSRQQPETSPDPRLDRARRGQYIDLSGLGEHPSLLRLSVLTNRRRSLVFRNLEDMSQAPRRQPIFYGWWTVLACFVIMLTSSGFAFYAQGVYLDALVDQRGFPVWVASAGASTFFIVSGIIGYFTGYLIARFDVRVVMTVGTIVAAVGIWLIGRIQNEWQMFAVFALFGGGYSLAGLVPATSIVTRWFHRKRSVALAFASSGLSLGGIIITRQMVKMLDLQSLGQLAPKFAIGYFIGIVPITWLLLRPSPESMGLRPDGDPPTQDTDPTAKFVPSGTSFAVAVRSRYFRVVSAAFVLLMAAQVGPLQHLIKLSSDRFDKETAATALIVVTATSVFARITGGFVAKYVSLASLISGLILVQAAGIAVLAIASTRPVLYIGCVILGSAMGNLLMLHPLLLADAFGVKEYPRIYGMGSLLMVFGVALGPLLTGVLHDIVDYRVAFLVNSGVALLGLVIFMTSGTFEPEPDEPPRSRHQANRHPLVFDVVASIENSESFGPLGLTQRTSVPEPAPTR
jgi:MFS family permease